MQTNRFIQKDNLQALQEIPDNAIDLVYADPPFNTGRDFVSEDGGYTDKPSIENPASMLDLPVEFSWLQAVCTPSQRAYFATIIPRLLRIEQILKPTGAFYYHCDWRTAAHIRLILNQIFGQSAFRNSIVWSYKTTAIYDSNKHIWKNNHDNILFYAKKDHAFQRQYYPLTYQQKKSMYPYIDSQGRRYRNRSTRNPASVHTQREYADDNKGTAIESTWTDIPIASPKERTGYPTQKPIALLKRIIQASSHAKQIVLDPYCGSGTTIAAAHHLGRRWIGIDRNSEAIAIAQRRIPT